MSAVYDWFAEPAHWSGPDGIPSRLLEHVWYSALAVAIATVVALPVGLLIGHTRRGSFVAASAANFWRALPTLGLVVLVFRLEPLSIWPVLVALVALAVPPILLNTEVGIRSVDKGVREAASGMGMTGAQTLLRVELPLAVPLIMAGIRSGTGQVVASATIAAYVGLGGLGRYVIDGFANRDYGEMAAGAILVALVALAAEGLLAAAQRWLTPVAVRREAVRSDEQRLGKAWPRWMLSPVRASNGREVRA